MEEKIAFATAVGPLCFQRKTSHCAASHACREAIARMQKEAEASKAANKDNKKKRGASTLWFKAAQEGLIMLPGPAIG